MSIQPLPGDVISQIRSSAAITSLNGAVCGLLENSLDAGASKINVSVDYSRGGCSVEDNGLGIAPADFQDGGGLGRLHYTSKYPPRPECHGRRGEFLASLASLSLLSIASHHRDYRTHNSMTILNARVVSRSLPAPPEQRVLAFPSGTRVVVRDLFGSLPVRVKQRAMEVERVGTSRDFEQLIRHIVARLLPWPGEVSVSVQDTYSHRTVYLRAPGAADGGRNNPRNTTVVSRSTMLLAQSSMVGGGELKHWVPIGATAFGISVQGCVSLQPVATKRVQFIALGVRPLLNDGHSNILYGDVNRVFEESNFGVVEDAALDENGRPTKTQGFTSKELKPKRGIDRWPMFFLRVMLSNSSDGSGVDEVLHERSGLLAVIADLLQIMAYEFLKKHHFRPRTVDAVKRLKEGSSSSQASKQVSEVESKREVKRAHSAAGSRRHASSLNAPGRVSDNRAVSPFAAWSRSKSSLSRHPGSKEPAAPRPPAAHSTRGPTPQKHPPCEDSDPLFDMSGLLLRKPFDDLDEVPENEAAAARQLGTASRKATVVWVDPQTKIKSLIDARTGFAVKAGSKVSSDTTRQRHRDSSNVLPPPRWKPPAVSDRDSIFQATEPRIAQVVQASDTACCAHGGGGNEPGILGDPTAGAADASIRTSLEGRISKAALRSAAVLGQVDQKFILATVAAAPSPNAFPHATNTDYMLVLIDQHAADERCRVEALMEAYFGPDPSGAGLLVAHSQGLDKPLRFDLPRQEGELLVRFQRHFAHWGIVYDVYHREAPSQEVTIEVQTLPTSILERCRLEPRLLVDLLRKEIWKLHGLGSRGARHPRAAGADSDWVARFHDCPEGILDLINSRACRSAIMFNDPLTVQQCVDLVRRLAVCAFPFQCAHGRPSMVPLVHVGEGALGSGAAGSRNGDLLGALKRWKQRSVGQV